MQPSLWGPHLWRSIHYIALGFPDEADELVRANYKEFYVNFWKMLPCLKCSVNYKRHLKELPSIDLFLGSRDDLFAWTVALHNTVNLELGKPKMTVDDAKILYTNGFNNDTSPAPAAEQIITIVEKTVGNYLPQNIAIVTLVFIVCLLLVFIIAQRKSRIKRI